MLNILSGLIWVQSVCKCSEQMILVGKIKGILINNSGVSLTFLASRYQGKVGG